MNKAEILMVGGIAEHLDITVEQVVKVAEHFNMTIDELGATVDNGDIRTFSDYTEMLHWVYDGADIMDIVEEALKNGGVYNFNLRSEQYLTLDDETTVYIYL